LLTPLQTRDSLGKAVALAAPSPQEQAAKIAAHTAAEIDRLTAALESGDKATAERALAQLRGPAQEQLMFTKALAEQSGDPAIIASTNKACTLEPQLVTAAYPIFLKEKYLRIFLDNRKVLALLRTQLIKRNDKKWTRWLLRLNRHSLKQSLDIHKLMPCWWLTLTSWTAA
jgi:hypothetical protein